jgi:hypothetical protein
MKPLFLAGSLMLIPFCASAQTPAPAPAPAAPDAGPAKPHHIVFHPTATADAGVDAIQVGGGSRGGENLGVDLMTLVPEKHVALTTQAQPSLYWYQSKATEAQCEVTLTQPKVAKPLLILKTSKTTPAGIHAIRLSKFNVELKPNVVYQWSVAVVVDPTSRSGDIYARGVIKRIDPSPELAAKLAAPDADKAAIFAENGIWYDALQSISDQIDKAPTDQGLKDERASLIDQVGLKGAEMESNTAAMVPTKSP